MSKINRNGPCPCGSGRKYKNCCLKKEVVQSRREQLVRERLVRELLRHFKKHHMSELESANALYWDDFEPEKHLNRTTREIAEINFWEWIVYDFEVDDTRGKTLIDAFLEKNVRLSPDELSILNMMKNSVISLFEVKEVFPEEGLLVEDLLLGGEYNIKEKAATRSLSRWDIFAARLLHTDGQYVMSGAIYPYAVKRKEEIIAEIKEDFEYYKEEYPDCTLNEYLKKSSENFVYFWYLPIQNPTPIELATTTGEPLLFSKAHFEFKDRDRVLTRLGKIREFEESEEDEFVWFAEQNKDEFATVLGRLKIMDKGLLLECNSKARLERGKRLLYKHIPELTHKIDSFEDPMQAMEAFKGEPAQRPAADEVPMEIQQEIYTRFMQRHCENWLHESIPALDGETPMDAVKTESGKTKVKELLKSFENAEEHNERDGRPHYDVKWMWETLGLERGVNR